MVFHSDQGSEYTSARFRQACERLGVRQSMGRPLARRQPPRGSGSWAFHPGVRAAVPAQVRHQGSGAGHGRRLDRGLQPCPRRDSRPRHGLPGRLRAVAGGNGRHVTAAGPLRGPDKRGGCAAAVLLAPANRTGPPPRPPGCCRIALRATALRAALDPGNPCGPGSSKSGQAAKAGRPRACPGRDAGARRTALPGRDHYNRSLHGFRGTPQYMHGWPDAEAWQRWDRLTLDRLTCTLSDREYVSR